MGFSLQSRGEDLEEEGSGSISRPEEVLPWSETNLP